MSSVSAESRQRATLEITGMTCAACAARIEKRLNKVEGVARASVNLAAEKATVIFEPGTVTIDTLIHSPAPAMAFSSGSVVTNSLLLKRFDPRQY